MAGFLAGLLDAVVAFLTPRRRAKVERPTSEARHRRGGGGALLPLQEFIEPRVEHVLVAQDEPGIELGHSEGDDERRETTLAAALRTSLTRDPLSCEEVRRCLAEAQRAGVDWRRLFDEAIHDVLASQPYLAPRLPPVDRVAPRAATD